LLIAIVSFAVWLNKNGSLANSNTARLDLRHSPPVNHAHVDVDLESNIQPTAPELAFAAANDMVLGNRSGGASQGASAPSTPKGSAPPTPKSPAKIDDIATKLALEAASHP